MPLQTQIRQTKINERRFAALMNAHQGHIRAFLRRLCRNDALADDLAQDTFLRAYKRLGQIEDAKAEKAWLFQIAYRIFLDHIRKEKRRKNIDDQRIQPDAITPEAPHGLQMDITRAMNTLPDDQRAAIMLCFSYGLSHSEAAKALNQPLGTVKSHISRGKLALRAFLTAYEKA